MTSEQELVRRLFVLTSGHPARWVADGTSLGDFEDRAHTLEIFDVPAVDQWPLFRRLQLARAEAKKRLGHRVSIIFHTPAVTTAHFPDVRETAGLCRRDLLPGRSVRAIFDRAA